MRAIILGLVGICCAASVAKADAISTFALDGAFTSLSAPSINFPLSGSLTINTTAGIVTDQTVFLNVGNQLAILTQGYNATAQSYFVFLANAIGTTQDYLLFNTNSLVNYTGGFLASRQHPTATGSVSSFNSVLLPVDIRLNTGSAALIVSSVPEPMSLVLLGGALIGVGAQGWSRRHSADEQQVA